MPQTYYSLDKYSIMVKTAVHEDVKKIKIVDYPETEVKPSGIIINMELCGICGTDMRIYEGKMNVPFSIIPGHRFEGVIEDIGEKAKNYEMKG